MRNVLRACSQIEGQVEQEINSVGAYRLSPLRAAFGSLPQPLPRLGVALRLPAFCPRAVLQQPVQIRQRLEYGSVAASCPEAKFRTRQLPPNREQALSVTFSILCHNYGKYLKQAVDSCLVQRAPGVKTEVWVVDDGSTDETLKVCAEYGGRIRVLRSENLGFGSALTRAVQEASGDWVFFLDADDYFAPTKLAAFLPHFRNGVLFVNDLPCSVDEEGRLLAGVASVGGCTSTIAVFRAVALDLLPVENELYFHILERAGKGAALKETHTFYRVHNASMTNRRFPGVWNSYLASMTHRLADRLEVMSACPPRWLGSAKNAWTIAWHYRAQAWYNELEVALECKLPIQAWGRWFRMAFAAARGRFGLELFHWKMLAKTILLKPSFPKSLPKK